MIPDHVEAAARAAHEANRAYCLAIGDTTQVGWDEAADWQRHSAITGVMGVIAGNDPKQSHEGWLAEKQATGWKYGPVKDPERKEHPCFLPYEDLSPEQRAKDDIFVSVARSVLGALLARAAHEANRAYCLAIGDTGDTNTPPVDSIPQLWQRPVPFLLKGGGMS